MVEPLVLVETTGPRQDDERVLVQERLVVPPVAGLDGGPPLLAQRPHDAGARRNGVEGNQVAGLIEEDLGEPASAARTLPRIPAFGALPADAQVHGERVADRPLVLDEEGAAVDVRLLQVDRVVLELHPVGYPVVEDLDHVFPAREIELALERGVLPVEAGLELMGTAQPGPEMGKRQVGLTDVPRQRVADASGETPEVLAGPDVPVADLEIGVVRVFPVEGLPHSVVPRLEDGVLAEELGRLQVHDPLVPVEDVPGLGMVGVGEAGNVARPLVLVAGREGAAEPGAPAQLGGELQEGVRLVRLEGLVGQEGLLLLHFEPAQVPEEPGAVAHDGSAERAAVLLVLEVAGCRRKRFLEFGRQVAGLRLLALVVAVHRSGELVAAGLGDEVEDAAERHAELGRDAPGGDLDLLDHVDRDLGGDVADGGVVHARPVDVEQVVAGRTPMDGLRRGERVLAVEDARHRDQQVRIGAPQRDVLDQVHVEGAHRLVAPDVHERRFSDDGHHLLDSGGGQRGVEPDVVSGVDHHALEGHGLESRELDRHRVGAGREQRDAVVAPGPGHAGLGLDVRRTREGHRGARDREPLIVGDLAVDRSGQFLRESGSRPQQEREAQDQRRTRPTGRKSLQRHDVLPSCGDVIEASGIDPHRATNSAGAAVRTHLRLTSRRETVREKVTELAAGRGDPAAVQADRTLRIGMPSPLPEACASETHQTARPHPPSNVTLDPKSLKAGRVQRTSLKRHILVTYL